MSILKANRIENLTTDSGGIDINNSGNVGVGTTSPDKLLHVNGQSRFEDFVRGSSVHNKVFISDDIALSAAKKLYLDGGSNSYIHETSADNIAVVTSGSERLRVQSGGGISFNGDTAAANALSDYEEGTWTPAISNTGYTFTYSVQNGQYTKIGRLVTLRFRIVVTARSGSASGGHPIINLPIQSDGEMDNGNFRYVMPSELVVHKVGTTTSSGAKTLLFGGFGNGNRNNFWVNNPTVTNTNPFDLGSDFNLGGVITYTV